MSSVIKNLQWAKHLASAYAPIIYQEIHGDKDFIVPYLFDKNPEINLGRHVSKKCPLYFGAREDDKYYYLFYNVYHAFDWSSSTIGFIRKMDSHRHDTESILYRVDKDTQVIDCATVTHYMFQYESKHNGSVTIEAESHAIFPHSARPPVGNYIKYKSFDLVNLNEFTKVQWETMRKALKGNASMPQEQRDDLIGSGMQGRKFVKAGDIFLRPERVFEAAKKKGRL